MQKILLLIGGGILLGYAFPPYNFSFFLFFAFIPLFLWFREKRGISNWIIGSFAFFSPFLCFVSFPIFLLIRTSFFHYLSYPLFLDTLLSLFIYGLLISIYLLPYMIFSSFVPYLLRKGVSGLFFLAFSFSLLEYSFSLFLPYPYLLGYGVSLNGFSERFVSIFGASGVSFLIVFTNLLFFYIFFKEGYSLKSKWILTIMLVVVTTLFSIPFSISSKPLVNGDSRIHLLLVQRAIDFRTPDFFKELEHLIITTQKERELSPDLVVWPESAIPIRLCNYPHIEGIITNLAERMHTYLVFGTYGEGTRIGKYNQAVVVSPKGKILTVYSKIKIIPFFEGPPIEDMLTRRNYLFSDRNFIKGNKIKFFTVKKRVFGLLICSEVLYSEMFRKLKEKGANGVIILSNEMALPKMFTLLLLKIARFRAVENGVTVIRVNTTGGSAIISPYGKLEGVLSYGKKGVLYSSLDGAFMSIPTFYSRYGITPLILGFLFSGLFLGLNILKRSNKI